MKKLIYSFITVLMVVLFSACGNNSMTFEDQIKKDVLEKIAGGYCEGSDVPKDAKIQNIQVGEITPIGNTGMIDVSLEFDVVGSDGTTQHKTDAMLYLKNGGDSKMLAVFCDYDYRGKQ